jgi:hypothetical protein
MEQHLISVYELRPPAHSTSPRPSGNPSAASKCSSSPSSARGSWRTDGSWRCKAGRCPGKFEQDLSAAPPGLDSRRSGVAAAMNRWANFGSSRRDGLSLISVGSLVALARRWPWTAIFGGARHRFVLPRTDVAPPGLAGMGAAIDQGLAPLATCRRPCRGFVCGTGAASREYVLPECSHLAPRDAFVPHAEREVYTVPVARTNGDVEAMIRGGCGHALYALPVGPSSALPHR